MNFSTFIVIDEKLSTKKSYNGGYEHTTNGCTILPLDTPIPIIQKGVGCVGIGMIEELRLRSSSTKIQFSVTKISDAQATAYYNLYRNQLSTQTNVDLADQSDVIIPGMMVNTASMNKRKGPSTQNRPSSIKPRSLSDFVEDDNDDDRFDYHW